MTLGHIDTCTPQILQRRFLRGQPCSAQESAGVPRAAGATWRQPRMGRNGCHWAAEEQHGEPGMDARGGQEGVVQAV